jgi:hypothetical protein
LYAVPNTTTQTVVSSIVIANVSGTEAKAYLYVTKGSASAGTANALVYGLAVPANGTASFTLGLTLSNTTSVVDTIKCGSETSGALTFQAFGSEIS